VKIYCSGIGGIGLSAYAALRRLEGNEVLGSDRSPSALLDDLASQGIGIALDQNGSHVPADTDLFVYSEAIPPTAPERVRAAELDIRQLSYPAALGEFSSGYRVIAVAGTHGKSSTTAMAARLLLAAELDPTIVVGTKVPELDGRNWRKGGSDIFLLEACEYRKSFHHYRPQEILLTNADGDHFDFYKDKEEYQNAFIEFAKFLPADGTLITHEKDPDCAKIVKASGAQSMDADSFPLIALNTPGLHMRQNAQLVLALGDVLGIDRKFSVETLAGFSGSWRRMEQKGIYGDGIPVIDDYAHHPIEIRATLAAIREQYPKGRIVCVFQPHTHDRTKKLQKDFVVSFKNANLVIVPNIYDARKEVDFVTVDVAKLVSEITRKSGVEAMDGHSLSETEQLLPTILKHGDILVCMGAGDITSLAEKMTIATKK